MCFELPCGQQSRLRGLWHGELRHRAYGWQLLPSDAIWPTALAWDAEAEKDMPTEAPAAAGAAFWDGLLQDKYQQLQALELATMGKVRLQTAPHMRPAAVALGFGHCS